MTPSKRLKILFVTSELFPFMKTGGLADVSAALPQMLTELGHEVRILVPKYGAIDSRKYKIHEVVRLKDITVKIGNKDIVFSLRSSFLPSQRVRVQIYFLDNQEYFGSRKSLYTDPISGADYKDNDERFILLAKSVFQLVTLLGWIPDVIHSNDWQCGLIPAYHKNVFSTLAPFDSIKSIFTIHNLANSGSFPAATFSKTELPESLDNDKNSLLDGKFNFLKNGILYADYLTTVSEGYAEEIVTKKDVALDLYPCLSKKKKSLKGIINGIDTVVWNPQTDKFIPHKYSFETIAKKRDNKKILVERFGLHFDENTPTIGIISRLLSIKGMDLILDAFEELMNMNIQIVLLGAGEKKYQTAFEKLTKKHSDKFASYLGFNDDLAHLIEAGSDMLLMPSLFEPCGLNQMYSLAYGTIPIVRQTGGLGDTVFAFDEKTGEGNGFVFQKYDSAVMLKEVKKAVKLYSDQKLWLKIIKNGMKSDFSWKSSAKKYIELYKTVLSS
ncbi:MAG: glycogen synthase GlgA [Ignavibacteria bacterium]|nr:glycogen synthase GlgA [Ignavibacteria bacterium]OIO18987.1 MAG: glycogen synthase [Ignavibacteria bacterium CG1_02_37_35]PIX93046.1 MAG: glycogen synthase GlgA [Ignavibacteria bacterium CG_4_10_14_3_um_filter_37_18]PJC59088.1 MAG: glycogen synthase GlgA [Ignavibacteria bacterium CG_4_9_14_0_2_um_filter_37_13]